MRIVSSIIVDLRSENQLKVILESIGYVFRGGGVRPFRVSEVGNPILPVSFGYGSKEEGDVLVSLNGPALLSSLNVISLFFCSDVLMSLH